MHPKTAPQLDKDFQLNEPPHQFLLSVQLFEKQLQSLSFLWGLEQRGEGTICNAGD